MNVPTLLVGLGGTGSRIVQTVYARATEAQRKSLGFVIFDTDVNELSQIEEKTPQIRTIQTSTRLTVGEYLEIDKDSRDSWFPVNHILNSKALTDGAGQVRAISRLALHTAVQQGKMAPLDDAMEELYKLDGQRLQGNPRVIVTGTLCGGTGAGLVLPVSMYIRNYMATRLQQASVNIRGFFLLPDVLDKVIDSESERNNLRCNAYAAVRELDAFMMKADGGLDDAYDLKLLLPRAGSTEKDDYTCRPLDYCFLFDEQNLDGKMLDSYKDYLDQAVNCIYCMAVAPTSRRSSSSEDNVIREIIYAKGRNRYAGAGSSMLIYPTDDIKRYLSLRWTKETVTDAWLKVDEDYERERRRAKSRRDMGEFTNDVDRGENYVQALTLSNKSRNKFGMSIYKMCVQLDEDGIETAANWEEYLSAVKEFIDKEISQKRKEKAKRKELILEDMEAKQTAMLTPNDEDGKSKKNRSSETEGIINNYQNWYKALRDYENTAINITEGIARNLSLNLYRDDSDFTKDSNKIRLEYWLHPKGKLDDFIHPNAVRFFLYNVLAELNKQVDENRAVMQRVRKYWDEFDKKTFDDPNTDEEETAADFYKNSHFKETGFERFKNRGKIADNREMLNEAFGDFFTESKKYWNAYVYSEVYSAGADYVKKLCDSFEQFYDVIGRRVKNIDRDIKDLERKYKIENKAARRFVCADKTCLEGLASEVVNKNNSLDLPGEMCRRIYQRMHKYANAEKKPAAEDYFLNTFSDTVVKYLEGSIMAQYGSIVDMDVLSALAKEAHYIQPDKELTAEDEYRYLVRAIENSEILARPFIEAPRGKQARVNKACAYNPDLANDEISGRVELVGKYLSDRGGVADESIDRNMILFYQSIYDLRASQLGKFAPPKESETSDPKAGSYYKAYHELIAHIDPDSTKSSAVTPHLDRWWHVITKLPELTDEEQKEQEVQICRAFFWGMIGRFVEYRRSKLDEADHRLSSQSAEALEKNARNGSYRVDSTRLADEAFNDDLIVSNGTVCDRLYEVLDAFTVYPFLVRRVLEEVEDERERELYHKIPVEETQLLSGLRRFRLRELAIRRRAAEKPEGDEAKASAEESNFRSFLELPLLMKKSVPVQEYREKAVMQLLGVMLDEIYDYMGMFCPKKDLIPAYSELILEQFKLFLKNVAEDEGYGDEIYEDLLFQKICKTVTARFRSLNMRRLAESTEDLYDSLFE